MDVDYEKEFEIEDNENRTDTLSPYMIDEKLAGLDYDCDLNAIYIPFKDNKEIKTIDEEADHLMKWEKVDNQRIYLKISRNKQEKTELTYTWTSKKGNKKKGYEYKELKSFTRKQVIIAEDVDEKGIKSIIRKLSTTGNQLGFELETEDYKQFFSTVIKNITETSTLDVLKEQEYIFPSDGEISISNEINSRINPVLTREQQAEATEIENKIREMGYVEYMNNTLGKKHIGSNREIIRKTLLFFGIISGWISAISKTDGNSEAGKTYEDDIALDHIPKRYIFTVNDMTKASFTRYSERHERIFDRMIINLGDLGSKNAFSEMADVFNIFKTMITENEYSRTLSDKVDGSYKNVKLDLKVDSIGVVFQTTQTDFLDVEGDQLASRTFKSTPADADQDKVLDQIIGENGAENTRTNKKIAESDVNIKKFQSYILQMINKDVKIVNPWGNVFKRFVMISNTPYREMKQIMKLFRAFCILTYFNCEEIGVDGELLATQEQLETFMNDISLDNALPPSESEFLKMLIGKESNSELTILETDTEETPNKEDILLNPLNPYFNAVLEALEYTSDTRYTGETMDGNSTLGDAVEFTKEETSTIDVLAEWQQKKAIAKLLQMYRLKGSSTDHKENVFFTIKDIKRAYYRRKAYKNIDDVPKLLNKFYNNGFLDKLDYKDAKGQNIYYLTSKSKKVTETIKVTETDKEKAKEFLQKEWLGEYKV